MATKKKTTKKPTVKVGKTGKTDKTVGMEIGRTGVAEYRGYITADYNPEFNGRNGVLLCDKMRKTDGTVAAVLRALTFPIMASDWTIESADKNDEKQNDIAEFVRSQVMDNKYGTFNFNQFIREACGHLAFGFWYFEKVYDIRDGWVTLTKLASRIPTAHEKWEMKDRPTVPGVTQMLPSRKVGDEGTLQPEIPMSKLVLFVNEQEGDNNAGTPILRGAYKHFFMKDQLYRIDAVKHERGAGVLKIRYPNSNDREKAEEMGENFNVNEQMFMALPGAAPGPGETGWDVELMTAGIAEQSASLMESVRHHDRMIVQSVLAQFLDLGAGKTGSFALGETQMGFFGYALKAVADYMASVIDTQLIRELVDMNYGPQEAYPTIGAPRIGKMDQKQTAEILAILNKNKLLTNDPELRAWVTTAFGLPERTVDEIIEQEELAKENAPDPIVDDDDDDEDKPDNDNPDDTDTEEEDEKQMAMKLARRKLTPCEKRVKFAEAKKSIEDAEKKAQESLDKSDAEQKESLLVQSSKAIDSGEIGNAMEVTAKVEPSARKALTDQAKESLETGKVMAANELGVAVPATASAAKKAIAARIALHMQERADRLTGAVRGRLLDIIDGDMGKAAGLFEIEKVIDAANARTNSGMVGQVVMQPINNGRWLTFDDVSAQIHGMQRSEILDERTCPLCLSLDGRVLKQSDPMTQLGEVHDFCVAPDTKIMSPDATKMWKIPYDGEMIRLSFGSGGDLTITPNHILLTDRGFRAAKFLKDGDNVVRACGTDGKPFGIDPDVDDAPATAADIFVALLEDGGMTSETMKATPEDFHGDGRFCDGEVDVISSDGLLLDRIDPSFPEKAKKCLLDVACGTSALLLGGCSLADLLLGLSATTARIMRGAGIAGVFGCASPGHHEAIRNEIAAGYDARLRQAASDDNIAHSEGTGDLLRGLSGTISGDDFGNVDGDILSPVDDRDSFPAEPVTDTVDADGKGTGNAHDGFTGTVSLDDIVKIEIIRHKGFVYDLQTISSLYVSDGIISSNCRGMWVGILLTDADLPEAKPLPKSIQSRFDLVGGVPTTNGFKQIKAPVITKDSRVARKVKDGDLKI